MNIGYGRQHERQQHTFDGTDEYISYIDKPKNLMSYPSGLLEYLNNVPLHPPSNNATLFSHYAFKTSKQDNSKNKYGDLTAADSTSQQGKNTYVNPLWAKYSSVSAHQGSF